MFINKLEEKEQIKLINKHSSYYIKLIKNPSENVKLAAVKDYGYNIKYIKAPSEKVQIMAVKNFKYSKHWADFTNNIVEYNISSPKAIELYNKFNKVHSIIK
jgi:oligoribonuclease NrnB/cAMP/cGMP phosphodiesterase (DHH superfamily)